MEMVKQPDQSTGCGVAVFAMLTRLTYDQALAHLLTERGKWINQRTLHMTVPQMKAALTYAFAEGKVAIHNAPNPKPWCAVYVVYQGRYRHWLAWDGEQFFDPLCTALGPSRTIRRKITRVVATAGPNGLKNPSSCWLRPITK